MQVAACSAGSAAYGDAAHFTDEYPARVRLPGTTLATDNVHRRRRRRLILAKDFQFDLGDGFFAERY